MDSQASFLPAGYPTYSNAGGWEGTWPQESYPHTNTQGPYQYSPTQGSLQPLHEGTVPTSDHSSTFNQNTTQGYSHSFDAHNITVHPMYPIQGGLAANVYDNTVLGAYDPSLPQSFSNDPEFPLLSQEDLRVVVPQPPYECGNNQREWDQKPSILFSTGGHPGVRLFDAANGTFSGIDDRDGFPFNANCRGVTIRIHLPGYPSSTAVEKILKQWADAGVRSKARSMQLSTKNYKASPDPVTTSKLIQEVAKRIQWHIADLEANSDLFPFNNTVDEKWHLGCGRMKFEHMVITGLDHVSSGCWSPVICVE